MGKVIDSLNNRVLVAVVVGLVLFGLLRRFVR